VVAGELRDRCRALQEALDARGIPLEVVSGGEVDILWAADASGQELALASYGGLGRDLLLETPYGPLPPGFPQLLRELADEGFRLLLAHPERSATFQRDESALEGLAGEGVLVQVTAASLAANARRSASARTARRLVAEGTAHVIASDLHGARTAGRAPLSGGVAVADKLAGARTRWMVTDAPAAILAGRPLPPAPAAQARSASLLRRGRR
jgi:protein-tyrosine phosphatase